MAQMQGPSDCFEIQHNFKPLHPRTQLDREDTAGVPEGHQPNDGGTD